MSTTTYSNKTTEQHKSLIEKLSKPFDVKQHSYKPIAFTKNGAWVAFYIDLRRMVERLEEAVGLRFQWRVYFHSEAKDGYNVKATLTLFLDDGEPFVVEDYGYAPQESAEGVKSATTDALRRVLSHLGIGRYLYHLPRVFIRGERTEGGFKYDVDPLTVLKELLENPPDAEVVFYPPRKNDDADVGRSELTSREKQWLDVLGADEKDDLIATFKQEFPVRRLSDRQVRAFMRLVEPSEEVLSGISENADVYIKRILDEKLGA
ncbi:MAG: Rad52/Rad22 family DNA repair protein [Candidatus Caldarchaeum sp.]